jgi:hypothetical protein
MASTSLICEIIFLNGDLHEEVFVEQPVGFIKKGSDQKVLKLRKALYGLHQAPRAWNTKLDDTMTVLGFARSLSEPSIYTRKSGQSQLIVGVYVDNLVITGADYDDIGKFKKEMSAAFKMSDLGVLRLIQRLMIPDSKCDQSQPGSICSKDIRKRLGWQDVTLDTHQLKIV